MSTTIKYKINCRRPEESWVSTIECREVTFSDGVIKFWAGEYGETNRIIAVFPAAFTILELIEENEITE